MSGSSEGDWFAMRERHRKKLESPQYLGHWPVGSKIQLAEHDTRTNIMRPGRRYIVTRNEAASGHTVTIRDGETGAHYERDGLHPVWAGPGYVRSDQQEAK